MERLDQLIRLKATGNLETLSVKLRISVSTIKRQIELMKSLGAPIIYNFSRQSYEYEFYVNFVFGFKEIEEKQMRNIIGGEYRQKEFEKFIF